MLVLRTLFSRCFYNRDFLTVFTFTQGRSWADAIDAATLGLAPLGNRIMMAGQVVHFFQIAYLLDCKPHEMVSEN